MPNRGRGLLVLVSCLVLVAHAASAGVLARVSASAGAAALPKERAFTVDPAMLATLRAAEVAAVEAFPLGADGDVSLDLARIRPFGPGARIEEVTPTGVRSVPLPDETYFAGTVRGDGASRVILIAGAEGVRGFVARGGLTYPFGRDAGGTHRIYAMHELDPAEHPGPSTFCANDLHPDRMLGIPVPRSMPHTAQAEIGPDTLLEVEVALETDNEFRSNFPSESAATSYLTALLATANAIYENDLKVRLVFSYVRLWSTTDPWTATDTLDALDEVQAYWLDPGNGMNATAGPRDVVHFMSGKYVTGGVAYLDAACDADYGFGVSQVHGDSTSLASPDFFWDVLVVTHEIGHNLGSQHTHCYSPPLDHCFSGESASCWNGAESVPPGGGTIMSYCHLLPGGFANLNLVFGATVSATIRDFVTHAACIDVVATCGDGTTSVGEQCDDGNTTSGDGCSSTCEVEGPCGDGFVGAGEQCDDGGTVSGDGCTAGCQLETVCGNGAKEGVEQCDDGNTTSGDGCSYKCRLENACGNGMTEGIEQCDDGNTIGGDGCSVGCRFEVCGNHWLDVAEECDDGNVVSGDGCSASCVDEPLCGDGTLDAGEECDDGDTTSGDGCSAACMTEPCQIVVPHQATWAPAKVVATPGTFALRARFGVPSDALHLAEVAELGVRLIVDGATGSRAIDVVVPGGAPWVAGSTKLRYRDPSGSSAGVRSIVLRAKGDGITTVDLKVVGHGGPVPDANDAPPTVTVLLGDGTAGEVGACGRYAFNGAKCVKRGKRLTCR